MAVFNFPFALFALVLSQLPQADSSVILSEAIWIPFARSFLRCWELGVFGERVLRAWKRCRQGFFSELVPFHLFLLLHLPQIDLTQTFCLSSLVQVALSLPLLLLFLMCSLDCVEYSRIVTMWWSLVVQSNTYRRTWQALCSPYSSLCLPCCRTPAN